MGFYVIKDKNQNNPLLKFIIQKMDKFLFENKVRAIAVYGQSKKMYSIF